MFSYRDHFWLYLQGILDVVIASAAFMGAMFLTNHVLHAYMPFIREIDYEYQSWTLIWLICVLLLFRRLLSIERPGRRGTFLQVILRVPLSVVLVIVFYSFGLFIMRHGVTRPFLAVLSVLLTVLIFIEELLLSRLCESLRSKGHFVRNVVVYGTGSEAADFLRTVDRNLRWNFRVIGVIYDRRTNPRLPEQWHGYPVLGDTSQVLKVIDRNSVDDVIIMSSKICESELRNLIRICEEVGVSAKLLCNYFNVTIAEPHLEKFDKFRMLSFRCTPPENLQFFVKELFDRISAFLLLIILGPVVMLPIAIAIRLSSGNSEAVLFRQRRVGRRGRVFCLYKFRTMVSESGSLTSGLAEHNEMDGPVFKIKEDPRTTRLGRFLRRHSLDELPQLFNVIRGEMSLVGPRPPLPEEVELYHRWQRRKLSIKPGLTCIWQVNGRNRIGFERWMRMDLQYIDNWSLWLDLRLLAKTVWVVIRGQGM